MNSIHTLLLDDELFSVEVLAEEISWGELGISDYKCVSSVREAKAWLQNNHVNILICDIEMPGENGLDMIEWATEYTRFSAEPMVCIVLTCHPKYEYLRKAMQLGCLDYLLKPVDYGDITRCLEKAVNVINQKRLSMKDTVYIEKSKSDDIIKDKVFPFIENKLATQFSVSDIAEEVALNPQYLMRLFKKTTGMSVLEYVTKKRVEKSKELLIKTDWSLTVISEKVGYLNYTYFMKVFKSLEACTPGEYRKRYLQ